MLHSHPRLSCDATPLRWTLRLSRFDFLCCPLPLAVGAALRRARADTRRPAIRARRTSPRPNHACLMLWSGAPLLDAAGRRRIRYGGCCLLVGLAPVEFRNRNDDAPVLVAPPQCPWCMQQRASRSNVVLSAPETEMLKTRAAIWLRA
eukprot:6205563-Pleurochrysis_carterae.AAC.2